MKNHKEKCKCMGCRMERKEFIGDNNPNFIDGRNHGTCSKCGNKLINPKAKKCLNCYLNDIKLKNKTCSDCGKTISPKSERCRSCARKLFLKNHPNWNDKKKNYCSDCHKEISSHGVRCRSCAMKGNKIVIIDGRSTVKTYCKGCGKEIYYTSKRCKKCAKQGKLHSLFGKKFTEESKRKMSLIRGGTGTPYEKNDYPNKFYELRNLIRNRDNCKCQKCNNKGNFVHHIDYIKNNCDDTNLITLCNKCHSKTNFNRPYWQSFYTNKINLIYSNIKN